MHIGKAFILSAAVLTLAHALPAYAQDDGGWEEYESPTPSPEDEARFKDDNQVDWFRLDTEKPAYNYEDHLLSREKALYDENAARRNPATSIPGDPSTSN